MTPRPYNMGRRQAATEQTRARILEAARELLGAVEGPAAFSVEAVAKAAGVARMTVYYQFESKAGLLEALFDHLAARARMERMAEAFQEPDPEIALEKFIATFGRFWASDRLVHRRLGALMALDAEVAQAMSQRGGRRRQGLRVLLARLAERHGRPAEGAMDEAIDVLAMLTGFDTFDTLAGAARGPEEVVPLVTRMARAYLGLPTGGLV